MGADRSSLRAIVAALLVLSSLLFVVGIVIERNAVPTESHPGPVASPHAEGEHSEDGESGDEHPISTAVPVSGSETHSEAGESDATILGLDLESPLFVGAAFLLSLGLAFAVLRSTRPLVPWTIAASAVAFGLLDLKEASHQLDESRPGIAIIAIVLVAVHVAIAILAIRLAMAGRSVRRA